MLWRVSKAMRRCDGYMKKSFCLFLTFVMLLPSLCVSASLHGRAIWQDPGNIVVMWEGEDDEYKILRADAIDGQYEHIGTSSTGSFRDDTVRYGGTYFYKVQKYDAKDETNETSPFEAEICPGALSKVSVIMYHNFVTEEDVKSGVEYDEYSISPASFEEDLLWLKSNGYVTVTSDDLLRHLEGKKSLPHKAVIISIDDGSWGVYTNAYPLLKKYNMKADFNIIGANVDSTWEKLEEGGTREGESAPYCTWEELIEMSESGEINLCSHTYGLHVYNKEKRIGMSICEGESEEEFAEEVKKDYDLSVSCMEGWTGKKPETVAYPYSKRSDESDRIILESTGYRLLMAGDGARGTEANYFVRGCDIKEQLMLLGRPCRMDGTPIGTYLERIDKKDENNGINKGIDFLKVQNTDEIASDYQIFDDVGKDEWFSGSVYYSYLNGLMKGVGNREFAPQDSITRAMAATLLGRLAGADGAKENAAFSDSDGTQWWYGAASWATENKILDASYDKSFKPYEPISRENLAEAMHRCAKYLGLDMSKAADITKFTDYENISKENTDAVSWALANGILKGNADGSFNPSGNVTRAEMSMVLRNWLGKGE